MWDEGPTVLLAVQPQKMRKMSLLPKTDSLKIRGKEQLTTKQWCLSCPAWGGVVVKHLPVDFAYFYTAAFTIPNYPLKMHTGQWPVFLRTLSREFGLYIFELTFHIVLWDLLSVSEQGSKDWSQHLCFFSMSLYRAFTVPWASSGCRDCITFSRKWIKIKLGKKPIFNFFIKVNPNFN